MPRSSRTSVGVVSTGATAILYRTPTILQRMGTMRLHRHTPTLHPRMTLYVPPPAVDESYAPPAVAEGDYASPDGDYGDYPPANGEYPRRRVWRVSARQRLLTDPAAGRAEADRAAAVAHASRQSYSPAFHSAIRNAISSLADLMHAPNSLSRRMLSSPVLRAT